MARVKQTKNLNFRRKKNNLRKKTRRNLRKIKGGDVMPKKTFLSLPYEKFLEKVKSGLDVEFVNYKLSFESYGTTFYKMAITFKPIDVSEETELKSIATLFFIHRDAVKDKSISVSGKFWGSSIKMDKQDTTVSVLVNELKEHKGRTISGSFELTCVKTTGDDNDKSHSATNATTASDVNNVFVVDEPEVLNFAYLEQNERILHERTNLKRKPV